ncbi:MAG TPA: TonB-dependent receptor [Pseudomonadales bacterium]|nr:TonB-dependent receptor [Pseudomonadales bacterium]
MIEEVVVTGSRIRRADLESVSPVTSLSSEEFTISGIMNIEQKLAELPSTLPSFGPSSNNPGDGTARIDLRGLGAQRTLVLVNGRRYMPATQDGIVDLNTIPASLIESVDVVTGGASAVYGSDALAGVVNFRLMDDFEGVAINGLYDITEDGDAEKYNLDLVMGGNFDDGRGNATVYIQYSDRNPLFQGDRDFSSNALVDSTVGGQPALVPGGSSGIPGTRLFGGPLVNAGAADEFTLGRFNPDGTGAPYVSPGDAFNYAPDNFLQLPQERYLINATAHYDLTDTVRAYTEATFASNKVPQELAPTPAFLSTVEVNPESPFFAPSVQTALIGLRTNPADGDENVFLPTIGRRLVENGPRQSIDKRNTYRILVGIEGDINEDWSFDAYGSRSSLDRTNLLENDASDSRMRQALLVTDDGLSCQNTAAGCVPINIFGAGNISQDAVNFVKVGASNVTTVEQTVYQATVSGNLGNLIDDTAPVSVVLGAEYRKDESSFRPDTFLSSGDVLGFNAGNATVGQYDVTEFFAEVDVPLLSGMPGVEYLGVWGAARTSDYSNIGRVSSYAMTGTYEPMSGLSFRAGFQRAVRAPNVAELFQGTANGFPTATDPCSVDGNPDPSIVALCEATGVLPGTVGVFTQANTQIEGRFGGNPNLKEETADTVTVGLVYQPEMIEGMDITLDYYSIKIEDAIDVLGGGVNNVLDICYNQVGDINSPFCQAFTRRPDGNVNVVNVLNQNIAELETEGVDLALNHSVPLDFGIMGNGSTLSFIYRSTFLLKFDETPTVGLPQVNNCEGTFGNTCGSPRSEYQHNFRTTWQTGPMTVSMLWRYLSEVDDDRIENAGAAGGTLAAAHVDAINYFDLAGSWQFTEEMRVNFGVRNLFDEEPTAVGSVQEQANTFPEVYDVIGRRYFVSASYQF